MLTGDGRQRKRSRSSERRSSRRRRGRRRRAGEQASRTENEADALIHGVGDGWQVRIALELGLQ